MRPSRTRAAAPGAMAATIALLGLVAPSLAAQPPDAPRGPTRCDLTAWTNNALPGPIPVRAAPRADAPVIGTLPLTDRARDAVHEYSVTFRITGTTPGWLRITDVNDRADSTGGAPPRPVPAGEGWIPDHGARFAIQSARGHLRPDPASPRLVDLGTAWLTDMASIERLLGCDGPWVLLEARERRRIGQPDPLAELPLAERRRLRAWFRGVCGAEETTCDMRSVDE